MFWSSALFFEGSSHCFPTTGQNFSLFYKRYKRNRKLMHGNKFIFCSPSCHWLLCFQAILLTTNVGVFYWEINNHTLHQGMSQLGPSGCTAFTLWLPTPEQPLILAPSSNNLPPQSTRHFWMSKLTLWHLPNFNFVQSISSSFNLVFQLIRLKLPGWISILEGIKALRHWVNMNLRCLSSLSCCS